MNAQAETKERKPEKRLHRRSRLTERDRRVLVLLGEHGCLTGLRIKAYLWNSTPASSAYRRRLRILMKRGLIEKVAGDPTRAPAYRLAKRGKAVIGKLQDSGGAEPNRRAYQTQFQHDQILFDARRILERSPLIRNFMAENDVRNLLLKGHEKLLHWEKAPVIPDAMFTYAVPGKTMRIAVELELNLKARQRYTRIFRSHLLAKSWQLTIYIVKGDAFRKRLMKVLADVRATDIEVRMAKTVNGIYFCTLEDFLLQELSVPMTNGKKEFSFADAAQTVEAKT